MSVVPRRRPAAGRALLVPVVASTVLLALACSANPAVNAVEDSSSTTQSFAGYGDRPTSSAPRRGGKLAVALSAETDSYNPFKGQWSVPSFTAANAFFDPLAAVDSQGIAHPNLAEAIDPGPGFMSWTIKVRPDVRFHDGTPFDAAALKKNLDDARASGLTAQAFTTIDAVEVTGPDVVSVMMTEAWATFPATLASQAGFMAAPSMLDDPKGNDAIPVGTGPFSVVERVRDNSLKTKRNPDYWRTDANGEKLPYLDAIEFQIVPDGSSRNSALAAGDVDAMNMVTPDLLDLNLQAAQRGEVQIITDDARETDEAVLAFNTAREPFDDLLARQVVAAAIDQQNLSDVGYQGMFPPAWGMFEATSPYFVPPDVAGYAGHDAERAKQLAVAYEQKHGKKLEFTALVPADTQYLAIGQAIQQQLTEAGVTVNLESVEQTQLIRRVVVAGDFQASGFVLRSSPSPDQSYIFLATKANPTGLSLNFARFDSDIVTDSMKAFRAAADPQTRTDALAKVQKEIAANLPMVFLVHQRTALAYSNSVHGLQATSFPGTQRPASAPYPTTPFFAAVWKD